VSLHGGDVALGPSWRGCASFQQLR